MNRQRPGRWILRHGLGGLLLSVVAIAGSLGLVVGPAGAATFTLNSSLFTGATQTGPYNVVGTETSNSLGGGTISPTVTYPCLTAGTNQSATPIPGCDLPSTPSYRDSGSGSDPGWLRITTDAKFQVGSVFYSTALPTTAGLDIKFNTAQWENDGAGDGADGIGFALAAADPADPTPPSSPGPVGGDLGYSSDELGYANNAIHGGTSLANNGLPQGYLGFGLDVFGNYSNPAYQGSGCSTSALGLTAGTQYPEAIAVKLIPVYQDH